MTFFVTEPLDTENLKKFLFEDDFEYPSNEPTKYELEVTRNTLFAEVINQLENIIIHNLTSPH